MFKLLVTTIKCSHVGAGVSVSTVVLEFDTSTKAGTAYNKLQDSRAVGQLKVQRTVECLY